MRKTTTRKASTALVHNPGRGLSLGSRKVRTASRRTNPVKRRVTAAVKPNPRKRTRRRRNPSLINNPAGIGGLVFGAAMAAIGVTAVDLIASRLPQGQSLFARVGVKLGLAYAVQQWGHKVPVLGKYKGEVALVLATIGLTDIVRAYLVPPANQLIGQLTGGALSLVPAPPPAAASTELGNVWNGRRIYA